MTDKYVALRDLLVYRMSVELSDLGWSIYDNLDWKDKKTMGDQFIRAVDSFGANIAEGYGRYHYLDKVKFYYNARASLVEAKHWVFLLNRRQKISEEIFKKFISKSEKAGYQLNLFISTTYQVKNNESNRK